MLESASKKSWPHCNNVTVSKKVIVWKSWCPCQPAVCLITKTCSDTLSVFCLPAGGDTRPALPAGCMHGAGSLHRGSVHPRTADSGCQDVPGAEEKRQPDRSARQHAASGQRRGLRASSGGQHCVTVGPSNFPPALGEKTKRKKNKTSEQKPPQSLPEEFFFFLFN